MFFIAIFITIGVRLAVKLRHIGLFTLIVSLTCLATQHFVLLLFKQCADIQISYIPLLTTFLGSYINKDKKAPYKIIRVTSAIMCVVLGLALVIFLTLIEEQVLSLIAGSLVHCLVKKFLCFAIAVISCIQVTCYLKLLK